MTFGFSNMTWDGPERPETGAPDADEGEAGDVSPYAREKETPAPDYKKSVWWIIAAVVTAVSEIEAHK